MVTRRALRQRLRLLTVVDYLVMFRAELIAIHLWSVQSVESRVNAKFWWLVVEVTDEQ
jgi:hypothetical protein